MKYFVEIADLRFAEKSKIFAVLRFTDCHTKNICVFAIAERAQEFAYCDLRTKKSLPAYLQIVTIPS